jgi:hypothetical protein
MPGGKKVSEGLQALRAQRKDKTFPRLTPMTYDTATGRFECSPATKGYPGRNRMGGFPQFLYIPSKKQVIAIGRGVYYYDPDRKSWNKVKTQGKGPRGGEFAACYDSRRDRVYTGAAMQVKSEQGRSMLIFDVKTATWSAADHKGECPRRWSNNGTIMHYDSGNDLVVVFGRKSKGRGVKPKIYAYDPEADKWFRPRELPSGVSCAHGFYDPELNVHFIYVARDSADNGVMWAYRYGRAKKKQ